MTVLNCICRFLSLEKKHGCFAVLLFLHLWILFFSLIHSPLYLRVISLLCHLNPLIFVRLSLPKTSGDHPNFYLPAGSHLAFYFLSPNNFSTGAGQIELYDSSGWKWLTLTISDEVKLQTTHQSLRVRCILGWDFGLQAGYGPYGMVWSESFIGMISKDPESVFFLIKGKDLIK